MKTQGLNENAGSVACGRGTAANFFALSATELLAAASGVPLSGALGTCAGDCPGKDLAPRATAPIAVRIRLRRESEGIA